MTFKQYTKSQINEEFDLNKAVKDATLWMENKYGKDMYTFKHIENMDMAGQKVKSYDITVGENTYKLNLKKFDSNGDGDSDTIGFDVLSDAIEQEEEEEL